MNPTTCLSLGFFDFSSLPVLEVANLVLQLPSPPPPSLNFSHFNSFNLTLGASLSERSLGYSCCCRLLERFFYSKECCLNRTCQTLRSNLQLRDTIVFFSLPFPHLCTILIQEKGEWPRPNWHRTFAVCVSLHFTAVFSL